MAGGSTFYAPVTNIEKIFSINISNPGAVGIPIEWISVAKLNGLITEDGAMYVASYPADGKTTDNNAIYQITDLSKSVSGKLITTPGQYDGTVLSTNKKTMHITSWTPAQACVADMNTRKITSPDISPEKPLSGPVDITITSGTMHIPDLSNSRVVIYLM